MQLTEKKSPTNGLLKRLLITVGVDVLVFIIFLACFKPTQDKSAVEDLLLLAVFIINVCSAVATRHVFRKLYRVFLVNSLLACLIFHLMFYGWLAFIN
jgi:hypothetical protein